MENMKITGFLTKISVGFQKISGRGTTTLLDKIPPWTVNRSGRGGWRYGQQF